MKSSLSFLLMLFMIPGINAQEIDLEDQLVARYPFEGNAQNWVEDANHGESYNVDYRTDRFGNDNASAWFNGRDSRIIIPHSEDMNWDARNESYTLAFWVRSPNPELEDPNCRRILNKWSEIISDPYPFSFQVTSSSLTANIYIVSDGVTSNYPNPWDDEWHFITMRYSHLENMFSIYLDGEMVQSKEKEFSRSTKNSSNIAIGITDTPSIEAYYTGYIDDLYFYSRALNPCEIEALYSGQLMEER